MGEAADGLKRQNDVSLRESGTERVLPRVRGLHRLGTFSTTLILHAAGNSVCRNSAHIKPQEEFGSVDRLIAYSFGAQYGNCSK
jgi:hypothetical protein